MTFNLGPQHPSTHGVPRCISILHGEIIQYIITEIGLLHRGTEKLIAINKDTIVNSWISRSNTNNTNKMTNVEKDLIHSLVTLFLSSIRFH